MKINCPQKFYYLVNLPKDKMGPVTFKLGTASQEKFIRISEPLYIRLLMIDIIVVSRNTLIISLV